MILRHHIHREILRALWEALRVGDQLVRIADSGDIQFRQLSGDPTELVQRLAETFDESDLVTAGIADRNDAQIGASPRLLFGAAPVLALFAENDQTPFDLLLPDGLLIGNELPLYAMAHDHRIQRLLQVSNTLFLLVPTLDDVIGCLALGLPAAPTCGLEHLQLAQFRSIAEVTASRSSVLPPPDQDMDGVATHDLILQAGQDDALADETCEEAIQQAEIGAEIHHIDLLRDWPAVDLVISGWSFAQQRRVSGELLQRVTQRLAEGQRHLTDVDLAGVGVWIPSQNSAERLRFCWELQVPTIFADAVLESVSDDLHDLRATASGNIPLWRAPASFLEARNALWHHMRDTQRDANDLQADVEVFESHLQREVVEPFLAIGSVEAENPIRGALHMEFGQLSALLQCQAPFLQYELTRAAQRSDSAESRGRLEQSYKMYLAMVDRYLKIARELQR